MDEQNIIGKNIRKWREIRGMSAGDLVDVLREQGYKITPSGLMRAETKGMYFSVQFLTSTCKALKIKIGALYEQV